MCYEFFFINIFVSKYFCPKFYSQNICLKFFFQIFCPTFFSQNICVQFFFKIFVQIFFSKYLSKILFSKSLSKNSLQFFFPKCFFPKCFFPKLFFHSFVFKFFFSRRPRFSKLLYRIIIYNSILRQLIKNCQFHTCYCTHTNAPYSTKIGRKVTYATGKESRFHLVWFCCTSEERLPSMKIAYFPPCSII